MNKILLSTIILGTFIGSANAITVAGGKVTFNGEVTSGACSVASDDLDKVVTLDTIPLSKLTTANQLANAKKAFTITLKDCDTTTLKTVAIGFSGQTASGSSLLENTYGAGGAGNVGLQLFGPDGAALTIGTDSSATNLVANGQTVIPLSVDYRSINVPVTAGKVQSVATFTLTYL